MRVDAHVNVNPPSRARARGRARSFQFGVDVGKKTFDGVRASLRMEIGPMAPTHPRARRASFVARRRPTRVRASRVVVNPA